MNVDWSAKKILQALTTSVSHIVDIRKMFSNGKHNGSEI